VKARTATVKILNQLDKNFFGYEEATETLLKRHKFISEDKNFINTMVKGVIEQAKFLDFVIAESYRGNFHKLEKTALNILRIGVFQAKILHTPIHAYVNETVNVTKDLKIPRLTGLINGVLRHLADEETIEKKLRQMKKAKEYSLRYSFPEWLVEKWMKKFGETTTRDLLQFNNQSPKIYFRLNNLKTAEDTFFKVLSNKNISYEIHREKPLPFFTVNEPAKLLSGDLFEKGFYSVQDLSQAFAVNLLQPQDNEKILDLCAAPGGKSTYIAQLTQNKAQLTACDISTKKLKLLQKEMLRLGIQCISTATANSATVQLPAADKILVDAPCTGTGVINRKADIRWNRKPEDFHKTTGLQRNILHNAARSLKPGGTLVYSTCSIETEENEAIIQEFLDNHADFYLEPAQNFVEEKYCDSQGFVNIFPPVHKMSGAFAARLKKRDV